MHLLRTVNGLVAMVYIRVTCFVLFSSGMYMFIKGFYIATAPNVVSHTSRLIVQPKFLKTDVVHSEQSSYFKQ